MEITKWEIGTIKELREVAKKYTSIPVGSILCLVGDLGVGKTEFVKQFVSILLGKDVEVNSPTFTLINIYGKNDEIWHADMYRIEEEREFLELGLDEGFEARITVIEWADKVDKFIPKGAIWLSFEMKEGKRYISELA